VALARPPVTRHGSKAGSLILALLVALSIAGCLPRDRLNGRCQWVADTAVLAPPGDHLRRSHLIEDIGVAQELGIRYADLVVGRNLDTPERQRAQDECTEASLQAIIHRHGVSRSELDALVGAREWWIDLLIVFLPMSVLFTLVSWRVVARITASHDSDDRWFVRASLLGLAPVMAALGLGATQRWEWFLEGFRVRNEHLSSRVAYLPAGRHGWATWCIAMGVFAVIGVMVSRSMSRSREVAPLRGPGRWPSAK
jgi:hypothetical protein